MTRSAHRRLPLTLVAALSLHVGIFTIARWFEEDAPTIVSDATVSEATVSEATPLDATTSIDVEWSIERPPPDDVARGSADKPGVPLPLNRAARAPVPRGSFGAARSATDPVAVDADSAVVPEAPLPDAKTPTQTAPEPDADEPRIGLAQAGYGERSPWLLPDATDADPVRDHEDRLERNMAQAALARDYQRSVGIEGPIVRVLNASAYGTVPPHSQARISVVIESDGRVSSIDVMEVNSPLGVWQKMAGMAQGRLAASTLRVPQGRRLELVFAVESKVTLPSGAKPKSGVSVLGIPLGKKDDKHDTAVRLLSPQVGIDKVKVPKPGNPEEEVELPMLKMGFGFVELDGELSDIVATPRQVVHTKLIAQRVL